MYKLPAKFTGYNATEIGEKRFRTLCYSLQSMGLLSVESICGLDYPKNYYVASVSDATGRFNVYMNCFIGIVGFGEINDEAQEYLDKPNLAVAITKIEPELEVASSSQLNQEIVNESKAFLSEVEVKALDYWHPENIGRALFTWYFD